AGGCSTQRRRIAFSMAGAGRRLSTETVVKSNGRNEAVPLNVDGIAAYAVAVVPQVEVHRFALHRQVLRLAKLGAPADCPAALGFRIALVGASSHRQTRMRRISVTYDLGSIPCDCCSALHVGQNPIPIGVSDPSGRRGQPIELDFALVKEIGRARLG